MCLKYNEELTLERIKFFQTNNIKKIDVWKILLHLDDIGYCSPYQRNYIYKQGHNTIVSTSKIKDLIDKDEYGIGFFHAYTIKDTVIVKSKAIDSHIKNCLKIRNYLRLYFDNIKSTRHVVNKYEIVVTPCTVKVEDIYCFGNENDISVKALYIDKFSKGQ